MKQGHCTNLPSRCSKAKSKELLPVTGPRTSCPECGKPVRPVAASSGSRIWLLAALAAAILLIAFVAWFSLGRGNPPTSAPVPDREVTTAGLVCDRNPALTLSGSDVLGRTLAPTLVEAWLRSNGVEALSRNERDGTLTISGRHGGENCIVVVQGPNTADGLNALVAGETDIAMSAHQLSASEAAQLSSLGDMRLPEAEHVVGIDALAVVVHPSNPISEMTKGEISDALTGRVTEWNNLGGATGRINLHIGANGVRAADTAGELLGSPDPSARRSSSDAGVIEGVANDPLALGIVSYPAPRSVRTLAIGEQGATAFTPSPDTIATQSYPLTRRLYFYVDPTPANPNTRAFLSFVQGREGQAVVSRAGYGGQNVEVVREPVRREGASSAYRDLVVNARQLNIAFRFRTGAAELDNKALEDIDRLIDYLGMQGSAERPQLMLIGFADAQGTDESNMELSRQRAQAVAAALQRREVEAAIVRWFGEEQPVGDNSTVAGRERNRRVEIWVTQ